MTRRHIVLPSEFDGLPIIASVSGGKDSTALILALREAEIPARYVFADTGWEARETYDYLDMLRAKLGITIDVVGAPGGMLAKARKRNGFPAPMQRWCTRELKVAPLRAYHDAIGDDTVSAVGIRAEESASRAAMLEVADDEQWGGWVWRPLIAWSVADVLAIHHRHDLPIHPHYLRGNNRVGCYPCIFARKEEIRLMADADPQRVEYILALERELTETRKAANVEQPGRYTHEQATFFSTKEAAGPMHIDKVVEWSRTDRGGKQLPLLQPVPTGGCMRWGMCEAPKPEGTGEE